MTNAHLDRKEVLLRIKQGELTPEAGLRLLRQALHEGTSAQLDHPAHMHADSAAEDTASNPLDPAADRLAKPYKIPPEGSRKLQTADIAVIGMSCRLPGADNLQEFWSILESGKDSVEEIACERWDNRIFYNPDVKVAGTTACKWGGMLKDIEEFDPLFFGISQKEAELMDPQQRLFLQEAWRAIEHAGYAPERLSGTRCGVFVGVAQGDYSSLIRSSGIRLDSHVLTGSSSSMLAARIAYFLNLNGPNMPIDTACSSSLVAVHQACQSILNGESEMALAGGVNVLSTPEMHIMTSKGGMLSKDGKCRAFDDRADGFVPGEGVGAILLKPLARAVQDGDTIYGVIKASGVNQDGKTNGITAPSANSQTRLELDVYRSSGINPQSISYIEAHGTGTQLGDPIEVHALNQAFGEYTQERQFCAIGSVKTNIGHSLTAAGIAGLIKIMLCFQEKKLVPSLHYETPNPHIRFEDSPFYVNTSLKEWIRGETPRRAAVSSFGLSGTNCHLIIEEPPFAAALPNRQARPFYLLPLSAKNPELLRPMWKRLEAWLTRESEESTLDDLCGTLAAGRTLFPYRSAVVVKDLDDLWEILYLVAEGESPSGYYPCEELEKEHNPELDQLAKEISARLADPQQKYSEGEYFTLLSRLAGLYAAGYDADLVGLYGNIPFRRIGLPVYPFLRDKCWLPKDISETQNHSSDSYKEQTVNLSKYPDQAGESRILPQFDPVSDGICKLKWTGGESCLTDHLVNGLQVLPGAAYLELIRAVGEYAVNRRVKAIRHVTWIRPFIFSQPDQEMTIRLSPHAGESFEVSSAGQDGTEVLHAKGRLVYTDGPVNSSTALDIMRIRRNCPTTMDAEQCYRLHRLKGVAFERSFRTVRQLWTNGSEVLAELELPLFPGIGAHGAAPHLHPALIDGALQTVIGLTEFQAQEDGVSYLPFFIDQIQWFASTAQVRYVYTKPAGQDDDRSVLIRKYDILITDAAGQIVVQMDGVTSRALDHRPLGGPSAAAAPVPDIIGAAATFKEAEVFLFGSYWPERPILPPELPEWPSFLLLLHGGGDAVPGLIRRLAVQQRPGIRILEVIPGPAFEVLDGGRYQINPAQPEDYDSLARHIGLTGRLPEAVWNLWPLGFGTEAAPEEQLECHLYPPLFLSQAYMRTKSAEALIYIHLDTAENPYSAAVSGLGKTLRLEHPGYAVKAVRISPYGSTEGVSGLEDILYTALLESQPSVRSDVEVRYTGGSRRVKAYREMEVSAEAALAASEPALKEDGVYLITGGAGGLGTLFADHAAGYRGVKLVLAGRSEPDSLLEARMRGWRKLGAEVVYRTCRLQNREETQRLIDAIKLDYGRIDGIMHSAGVVRDALVWNKTLEPVLEVVGPKVAGTVYLDEATRGEDLDFFVLFSAIASVFGNTGQADYAYANSFMDYFAESREALRLSGFRRGKTLSLNWPLWQEGGMKAGPASEEGLFKRLGMSPLATWQGIQAFVNALRAAGSQIVVMAGQEDRIRQALKAEAEPESTTDEEVACAGDSGGGPLVADETALTVQMEEYLKGIIAKTTRLPMERIGTHEPFSTYGIDSIIVVELNSVFEETFGELPKTLMFEYSTIHELSGYFIRHHSGVTGNLFLQRNGQTEIPEQRAHPIPNGPQDSPPERISEIYQERAERPQRMASAWTAVTANRDVYLQRPASAKDDAETADLAESASAGTEPGRADSDIAIIGLAGMFPQAENVEQFWTNLLAGKDCIEEIPADRWDHSRYYAPDKDAEGKAYSKWGGFIPDVDKFDPLFFTISPREAERMDPQERLFLQTAWKTLEDAGYTPASLGKVEVGVYVGAMYGHYEQVARDMAGDGGVQVHSSFSSIANRVSYALNLTGPSIALDTMCSSSLTAIHLACESIRSGDCDLAIAGGVNVTIHPAKHLLLSQGKFLSTDGRCRSFGQGGDGYVPGEGVGSVLLKPLGQAILDRDNIYAVVKGSSLNHGGTTNGYTVPNPLAQAKVVERVFRKAKIDPAAVSYMEAHGTGTSLGDPIEIEGLIRAFGDCGEKTQFIPIGSVKSNVGHLESAAGIAGVAKLLLQLKHRMLVPSLHAEEQNPNIRFARSPFYVQQSAAEWKRPVQLVGGTARELPRIAGISAFGAGGSNAHLLLQEHKEGFRGHPVPGPKLFVLSARNEERLHAYARELLEAVADNGPAEGWELADMAFTLQVGREPLEVRLAAVAANAGELKKQLNAYLQGVSLAGLYTGNIRRTRNLPQDALHGAELVRQRDLNRLAEQWVKGIHIDFGPLHEGVEVRRISLPTYPFEKRRCWLSPAQDHPLRTETIPGPNRPASRRMREAVVNEPELLRYNGPEVGLDIIDGQIAQVTMRDRSSSNTFSEAIIRGLKSRFAQIAANGKIKAVVITGFDHIFSMGGTQAQLLDIAEQRSAFTDNPFFYRGLLETEIPVISAMQGHASGGGMLFGLYADIVLMAEEGVYSAVFTKFGFTPGMGATFVLKEKLGANLATEMMFTAKSYTGGELEKRGASVLVKPGAQVLGEALKVARMLADKPLHTLKVLKRELAGRYLDQLQPYIEREAEMHEETFSHPEVKERIRHYYVNGTAEHADRMPQRTADNRKAAPEPLRLPSAEAAWIKAAPYPPATSSTYMQARGVEAAEVTVREAEEVIRDIVDTVLHVRLQEDERDRSFKELGVDSISGVEIIRDLNLTFNLNLDAVALYDYPTIELLAVYTASIFQASGAEARGQAKVEQPRSIDRGQLPGSGDTAQVEVWIQAIVGTILHLSTEEIDTDASFRELGADSISGVEIIRDINNRFELNLDATALYDYPSIRDISRQVAASLSGEPLAVSHMEQHPAREEGVMPAMSSYLFKSQAGYARDDQSARQAVPVPAQPVEAVSIKLAPAVQVKSTGGTDTAGTATASQEEPEPEPAGRDGRVSSRKLTDTKSGDIAVIGIAGRFPGARNVQEFWENLKNGVDSIEEVPDNRWNAEQYYDADPREPNKTYSRVGGFLQNVDEFDPLFFNISPLEAESMDPQQRIFLEEAWHALEDAGYSDQSLLGVKCGVFVGACQGDYVHKLSGVQADQSGDAFTGNSSSILAARISYLLNLKGPSVALDTACSSSLVAIHQACLSIRNGDSDMALAGGVRLMLTPGLHIQSSQMEMLTPTGVCRAFDQRADGTILGEGAGVVVLKPLADALRDRDYVYGVIKGSGVNQDGRTNGITAPSAQAQTQLEMDVYQRAGISPEYITYVETHGTGTKLGDPIEFKALKDSFEAYTQNKQYCAIGSVKPNIGHTTMAAGVASFIKVLLSLKHKQIVPSLHFEEENEHIRFADSPFYVSTSLQDWKSIGSHPRMAAVSSFGFSGTNCHIVVEEAAGTSLKGI